MGVEGMKYWGILLILLLIVGCTDTPATTSPPDQTEEQTEIKDEPTTEAQVVEEVKIQNTYPRNKISINTTQLGINTTPLSISVMLNCSLNYSEEGTSPVLFENVPAGTCNIYYYYTGCGTTWTRFTYGGGLKEINRELDTKNICFTIDELRGGKTENFYDWEKEIKVGIIEVEPPDIKYKERTIVGEYSFLEMVNNPEGIFTFQVGLDTEIYPSFYYIDDWFNNEYKRITGKELSMEIEVHGPIRLNEAIPANSECRDLFTFFEDLAKANNIDTSVYDSVNYVYFDPNRVWSESNAYQNAAFRSCRHPGANISLIDTEPTFGFWGPTEAVRKVIHEMSHVFGALDTYAPAGGCKDPAGIPEPDKDPKFPQDKACIMCGCIMAKEGTSSCQSTQDIDKYVVCEKEAMDFGWID
jgi:hypothetical protein